MTDASDISANQTSETAKSVLSGVSPLDYEQRPTKIGSSKVSQHLGVEWLEDSGEVIHALNQKLRQTLVHLTPSLFTPCLILLSRVVLCSAMLFSFRRPLAC
jgi:hypothetical protein